ncbi:MAG: cytochrome c oxidase subunit II [Anaerolineae bacterium]|nr:cytochrome c oxidase subunit II [Anaerolineae bacterium]
MIHLVIVSILIILSTGAVYYGLTNIGLLPQQASEQALVIDSLFNIQWFFISFFFSLIIVFLVYSIIVFRRRPGEQGDGDHFEGNTRLEVIWTVVPLAIVLGLSVIGAQKLGEVERRDPGAMVVNVTASQFQWSFEYPEYEIVSDELVLPIDRQVLLRMRSNDVIHSFWVPEFRVKQDVLPGGESFMRELRITPIEVGENFKVRCAELCGDGHATMLANVRVREQAAFETWVSSQTCQGTEEECNGQKLAIEFCTGCHLLDGTAVIAPSWVGVFGSTETMDDGTTILVDEAYLYESIVDPLAHIVEGYLEIMPQTFGEQLTEQQIEELIAFIMSLAE